MVPCVRLYYVCTRIWIYIFAFFKRMNAINLYLSHVELLEQYFLLLTDLLFNKKEYSA